MGTGLGRKEVLKQERIKDSSHVLTKCQSPGLPALAVISSFFVHKGPDQPSPIMASLPFAHLEEEGLAQLKGGSSHWLLSTPRLGAAEPKARAKAELSVLFLHSHRAKRSTWHLGPGAASPSSSCFSLPPRLNLSPFMLVPACLSLILLATPTILLVSLPHSVCLSVFLSVCLCFYVYVNADIYACVLGVSIYVCAHVCTHQRAPLGVDP